MCIKLRQARSQSATHTEGRVDGFSVERENSCECSVTQSPCGGITFYDWLFLRVNNKLILSIGIFNKVCMIITSECEYLYIHIHISNVI